MAAASSLPYGTIQVNPAPHVIRVTRLIVDWVLEIELYLLWIIHSSFSLHMLKIRRRMWISIG